MNKIIKYEKIVICIIFFVALTMMVIFNINIPEKAAGNYLVVKDGAIVDVITKDQVYEKGEYLYIEYSPILLPRENYENVVTKALLQGFDEYRFTPKYKDVIDYISQVFYPIEYNIDDDGSIVIDAITTRSTKEWTIHIENRCIDVIRESILHDYDYDGQCLSMDGKYIIDLRTKTIHAS